MDMSVTPFENMFLNTFVSGADGDALKVYLLIYKDSFEREGVDIQKIQRQLGFDDERFQKAIQYRIDMDLFREKMDPSGEKYIEIISLRQAYFGQSDQETNEKRLDLAQRRSAMFSNVERIIQRELTPSDITKINETLDEYRSDPELVTEAFNQAKEAGNVDVKYVMGFIKSWRDQGIFSLTDLRKSEERKKLLRKKSPRTYKRSSKKTDISTEDSMVDYTDLLRQEQLNKTGKTKGEK